MVHQEKFGKLDRRILDHAPLSIITIDKDGNMVSANKFYKNFSKKKGFQGSNIFKSEFFIRENLVDDFRRLLADGTVVRREECYEKNSRGDDKYLKIVAVPLRGAHGNITGALSMAEDVTETVVFKKKLENLNKRLESKVRKRTAKLKEVNKELDRALELKSIFMADVSHELRTALTIIQGNLELIAMNQEFCEEDVESYNLVFEEAKKMSSMLTDLSMLSKSDLSGDELHCEKIDVNRLIASLIKALHVVSKEKEVTIKHENGATCLEMTADEDKMEKLLTNLIRNAIRYNKIGGWVKIKAEKDGNEIVIRVEDSGIGIPEEHLSSIFERFYRVDKARSRMEGGSGLGLSICKWVAEAHGGTIDVGSKPGKGSLFTVRLPDDQ